MFLRLMLTAMLAVVMAFAQRGGGGEGGGEMGGMGGGRGGEGGMGGGMRMQRQTRFDQFSEKLKLNKDQKAEAQTMVEEARKETLPVLQQLLKARQDLAGALVSGANDEVIEGLTKGYATLSAQLAGIEAKAFARILGTLKPNQQSKAAQGFPLLAEVLEQLQRGGGRGGRPPEGGR